LIAWNGYTEKVTTADGGLRGTQRVTWNDEMATFVMRRFGAGWKALMAYVGNVVEREKLTGALIQKVQINITSHEQINHLVTG
jgi:hypothetical protein